MRKLITVVPCLLLFALPSFSQPHKSRFELAKTFVVENWSTEPVRDELVIIKGASAIHGLDSDCEMHIGAEFDDSSRSDFPGLVLEPPNLCKAPKPLTTARANKLVGKTCNAHGFWRAWPEHLTNGHGASNPNHFVEIHPMVTLDCGGSDTFDFTSKLKAFDDLPYKPPATVNSMMDMQVWVCHGCSADDSMLSFDYCFGDPCKAGVASNFARITAEIIPSTIKTADVKNGSGPQNAVSVIARITPADSPDDGRTRPLKLYAVKGTKFYDDLIAAIGTKADNAPSFEILGIFTLDPFSIKRVTEGNPADGVWTSVPHPVSLIVFGEL